MIQTGIKTKTQKKMLLEKRFSAKRGRVPQLRFYGFTKNWNIYKLGNLGTTYAGLSGKTKTDFGHGDAKFITYVNVYANTIADRDGTECIEIDPNQNEVQFGDILFTISSEIPEEVGMSSVWLENIPNVYLNSFCFGYRPFTNINPFYLTFLLRSPGARKKIILLAQGISRYNISKNKMMQLYIPVPYYQEQTKIGKFFKNLDHTIALYKKELENLMKAKQGLLQKMFPKEGEKVPEIRFPGFTDNWEERKLGEITNVTSVKRIHQSDCRENGVRFLRARDIVSAIKNEKVENKLFISKEKYEAYSAISGKVEVGDLLVTGVGTIGVPYLITNNSPLYFKDGNIIWFKNKKLDGNFLFYSFIGSKIQKYIRNVAGIGTVGTYTIDSGKKTPILIPIQKEQIEIGNFFKKLDDTILLHKQQLENLKLIKKAFLQKMLI